MTSTIAAITTGGGGVVTTADASGNLSLLSGTTTILAATATGVAVTGTLTASSNISMTGTTVGAKTLSIYNADTGAGSYVISYLQTNAGSCNWTFGSTANGGAANFYSSGAGGMYLYTTGAQQMQFGTNSTERMRITSSGNVGIGTSSPSDKLEVVTSAVNGGVTVSGSVDPQYYLSSSGGNVGRFKINDAGSLVMMGAWTNIATALYTNGTERMRILSGGDVLVGTSSALANVAKIQISAGTGASITTETTGTSATDHVNFRNANGKVGTITTNGTATSYNTSSDYRLKDNVAPMIGALAKVAALKPVTYKWKSDGSDGQGFIAHELQEVVPDCVTGEKDATWEEEYEVTPAVPAVVDADGVEVTPAVEAVKGTRTVPSYQGVDTSFLVATLVASIQELKAIIDAQATRIAALESV